MDTKRFYYSLVQVGEDTEFDYLNGGLPDFKSYIKRPTTKIVFRERYVSRLDLLSYDVYNTVYLWWVIAIANNILDPFSDELVDQIIEIPNILDIYEFYNDNYVNVNQ